MAWYKLDEEGNIEGLFKPLSPLINYYVLKSDFYNYAQMLEPVEVPDDGIFSFSIIPKDSSGVDYIFRSSSGAAYVYFRQSDGRFRIATDDAETFTFNITGVSLITPTKITVRLIASNGVELYVDDEYLDVRFGPHSTFTIDRIGEGVTTFNVSLSSIASYPMITGDVGTVNPDDMIGSNNLTFIDVDYPLTADKYAEVSGGY